jgi:hypothetical protein
LKDYSGSSVEELVMRSTFQVMKGFHDMMGALCYKSVISEWCRYAEFGI